MAVPDAVAEHHLRAAAQLARLRVLAAGESGAPLAAGAAAEAGEAVAAVLACADAATRTVVAAAVGGGRRGFAVAWFLGVRQARLHAGASAAIAAAQSGDAAALRRQLQRLEALTSALHTVQLQVLVPRAAAASRAVLPGPPRPGGGLHRPATSGLSGAA